jgi:hypothetical protein
MGQWFSVEVLDGESSALGWVQVFRDDLIAEAISTGATDWNFHHHSWGAVFEVEFVDDDAWERFRASLTVQRALDAVPDPVSGLIIYRGRGGSSGGREPRRGKPLRGAGAAALPLPELPLEELVYEAPRLLRV